MIIKSETNAFERIIRRSRPKATPELFRQSENSRTKLHRSWNVSYGRGGTGIATVTCNSKLRRKYIPLNNHHWLYLYSKSFLSFLQETISSKNCPCGKLPCKINSTRTDYQDILSSFYTLHYFILIYFILLLGSTTYYYLLLLFTTIQDCLLLLFTAIGYYSSPLFTTIYYYDLLLFTAIVHY